MTKEVGGGVVIDQQVGALSVDRSHAVRAAGRLIDRSVPAPAEELADPAVDPRRLARRGV